MAAGAEPSYLNGSPGASSQSPKPEPVARAWTGRPSRSPEPEPVAGADAGARRLSPLHRRRSRAPEGPIPPGCPLLPRLYPQSLRRRHFITALPCGRRTGSGAASAATVPPARKPPSSRLVAFLLAAPTGRGPCLSSSRAPGEGTGTFRGASALVEQSSPRLPRARKRMRPRMKTQTMMEILGVVTRGEGKIGGARPAKASAPVANRAAGATPPGGDMEKTAAGRALPVKVSGPTPSGTKAAARTAKRRAGRAGTSPRSGKSRGRKKASAAREKAAPSKAAPDTVQKPAAAGPT